MASLTLRQRLARLGGASGSGSGLAPDLFAGSFPEQRSFVEDPAQLKAAFCTRRAAKSYSVGLEHMASALEYPAQHLIIGLIRDSVRASFWDDVLKAINFKHQLGFRFNETLLEARSPRGGVVRLLGMDSNDTEKRKALGQKRRKINVDEAQDFRSDLTPLVYGTLKPSVADWRGSISLTGTPGNMPRGLFYDVTTGKEPGWVVHRWTTFQNTAIPAGQTERMCDLWQAEIEALRAANPRVVETPWFRQNYLGEWVVEFDALVYRYREGLNDFDGELPEYPGGDWHYLLGVDLGYNDPTSFQVGAYHDHDPCLYIVHAEKESGMDVTAVAQRAKALDRRYNFEAWVIDNANKQAVEEMRKRHGCPWKPADKTGKADFIELMNAEYLAGSIKLGPDCGQLREEYGGLIWDDKSTKREEHPGCPNHCADGALYLWRFAYQYLSERPRQRPAAGSAEAIQEQEDEVERFQEDLLRQQMADAAELEDVLRELPPSLRWPS